MEMEQKHRNPELFVVLVALKEGDLPDYYVFRRDVSVRPYCGTDTVSILLNPKRDGKPRKELGFRWYDADFLTAFGDQKNDWKTHHRRTQVNANHQMRRYVF